MTATERIELLKAVADCAPEWMEAKFTDDEYVPCVLFKHDAHLDILPMLDISSGDLFNAEAIIAMLDAMEKEGFIAAVYPDFKVPQGEPLKYYVKLKRYSDGITVLATIHGGETRAEAVSRAFVAVFGGKE